MSCADHCYILGGHVVGDHYCDRTASIDNAFELLAMKPPSKWTIPERAFAKALAPEPHSIHEQESK